VHFIDLEKQQAIIKEKLDARIQAVLAHGQYIMGPEVKELEDALAEFCGAKHCFTCANGTDALQLALMAIGIQAGDAVFVPSFTFVATAEVVPVLGATPFFVDVDPVTFNMDPESLTRCIVHARKLGLRPAVVIPVDLFGLPADYDQITAIARQNKVKVISDSAQGFGGTYKGQMTGTFGDITTTSFFPAKPLGCYGDGGALFTDDDDQAILLDSVRVHGKGREKYDNIRIGLNSRLDTLQAAILLEKLPIFPGEIKRRNDCASRYSDALSPYIETPVVQSGYSSIWAQYTLKAKNGDHRQSIMTDLKQTDIPTVVYYPVPLHQQPAYKGFPKDPQGCPQSQQLAKQVFSIPMHGYLDRQEQDLIIEKILDCLK